MEQPTNPAGLYRLEAHNRQHVASLTNLMATVFDSFCREHEPRFSDGLLATLNLARRATLEAQRQIEEELGHPGSAAFVRDLAGIAFATMLDPSIAQPMPDAAPRDDSARPETQPRMVDMRDKAATMRPIIHSLTTSFYDLIEPHAEIGPQEAMTIGLNVAIHIVEGIAADAAEAHDDPQAAEIVRQSARATFLAFQDLQRRANSPTAGEKPEADA